MGIIDMSIKRSLDIVDVIAEYLTEYQIDVLIDKEMAGQEWETDVISFTPGRPATMYQPNGDPGDPAEPAEFEIDMPPEDVADMIVHEVGLNVLLSIEVRNICWTLIFDAEQKWQDSNLAEAVATEMEPDE